MNNIFILAYDGNDNKIKDNKGAAFFGYNLEGINSQKGKKFKEDFGNGFDTKNNDEDKIFNNYKKNINVIREFFINIKASLEKLKSIENKDIEELNNEEKQGVNNFEIV